jgi:hypothetical protein
VPVRFFDQHGGTYDSTSTVANATELGLTGGSRPYRIKYRRHGKQVTRTCAAANDLDIFDL